MEKKDQFPEKTSKPKEASDLRNQEAAIKRIRGLISDIYRSEDISCQKKIYK